MTAQWAAGRRGTPISRGIIESLGDRIRSLLPIPIRNLLALDAPYRPWHGDEALRTYLAFTLRAASKTAVANPSQRGIDLTQQGGVAIHVADRQIPFRRILNLIHLICALLDGDAIPLSQCPNQIRSFSFEDHFEAAGIGRCCVHGHLLAVAGAWRWLHDTVQKNLDVGRPGAGNANAAIAKPFLGLSVPIRCARMEAR